MPPTDENKPHRPLARLSGRVACVVLPGLLFLAGCSTKGPHEGEPAPVEGSAKTELVLVSQESPWLVAAAAPLAARLGEDGTVPRLAVVGSTPGYPMAAILRQFEAKRVLLLAPSPKSGQDGALLRLKPEILSVGVDPVGGSLLLAKRFWGNPDEAVAARADDPRGLILAAALAARQAAPLLVCEAGGGKRFVQGTNKLGLKRLTLLDSRPAGEQTWLKRLSAKVNVLDPAAAERRLAAASSGARTVILTRAPSADGKFGATAWLAPYLGLLRGAPLVIVATHEAATAESSVFRLIETVHLRPRTLTILADYGSIGVKRVVVGRAPAKARSKKDPPWNVDIEPCMPEDFSGVARLGIGRIVVGKLEDASLILLRGALRTGRADEPLRVLLAANSRPDVYPLPLCETVSRLTAEEFANCGASVDAFYGVRADSPSSLRAMRDADIILFEGHTLYQDLFPKQLDPEDEPEDDEPAEEESLVEAEDLENLVRLPDGTPVFPSVGGPEFRSLRPGVGELAESPVVILQSCHSLKTEVHQRILEQGGVALLGASTPIHSGSGSAFANALCDSLLHRGATLGEALRDAQNFLICLQDLRGKRQHNELAKIQRVALSFRLWGDPELCPIEQRQPKLSPVEASWTAGSAVEIRLPEKRLPPAITAAYVASMYPGSQPAGIVQRLKHSPARHLSPVYFFRLKLPQGLRPGVPDAVRDRAVVRVDRWAGLIYLVYLPEQESPAMNAALPLGEPGAQAER